MEKMMENLYILQGSWAAPQAVTGQVKVVEIDGIDMKKLFVNFFFVTADRYTTLALRSSTRSKWENRKIVFFDLQKIFYVSWHAQKFVITNKNYCVDCRYQNVRSVFQKKVITFQDDGEAWRILLYTQIRAIQYHCDFIQRPARRLLTHVAAR